MSEKVFLILVDGMRPDGCERCGNPYAAQLKAESVCPPCRSVMPSVTLPCHMSLFHAVTPQRHGILTNTYVPQVRPVEGLTELAHAAGKKCAFFYNWENLRDLAEPGALMHSCYRSQYVSEGTDARLTGDAIAFIAENSPDFVFLYLGQTDDCGHKYGWMSDEYLATVKNAWDCIRRVVENCANAYNIIVTADHGGHDMIHGTEADEDMITPLYLHGHAFASCTAEQASITDIAPTAAKIMQIPSGKDWTGVSLI